MKNIEEKYQILSETEHILKRSGRYIGSTKTENEFQWFIEDDKAVFKENLINKGLLKLFDEIISNSVDEHKRNPKLNCIKITIDTKHNSISVWDNGGIPVRKHLELTDVYVPTLIFSSMRTGTNFNDEEERTGAGTHGEGSVLVNIFSKLFRIETCDGKNKFFQEFYNNMSSSSNPEISKGRLNFTNITFQPDLQKFNLNSLKDVLHSIKFRILEIAATNPSIKIEFVVDKKEDETIVNSFKDFVNLFFEKDCLNENYNNLNLCIAPSNNGFKHLSFVNSVRTFDGGTHLDYITNSLIEEIRTFLVKKHKVEVKPADIKNHLFIFINCVVKNPEWGSQTKEKLISKKDDFLFNLELTPKFIKEICNSEIVSSILDWIDKKKSAEESKLLRDLEKNKSIKVEGLIDAKDKDRSKCSLYVFEGLSALSAVRKLRDARYVGAFPLRGKFINVFDLKPAEIVKNNEALNLMNALGLKIGKNPFEYSNVEKVLISCSDGKEIEVDIEDEILIDGKYQKVRNLLGKQNV